MDRCLHELLGIHISLFTSTTVRLRCSQRLWPLSYVKHIGKKPICTDYSPVPRLGRCPPVAIHCMLCLYGHLHVLIYWHTLCWRRGKQFRTGFEKRMQKQNQYFSPLQYRMESIKKTQPLSTSSENAKFWQMRGNRFEISRNWSSCATTKHFHLLTILLSIAVFLFTWSKLDRLFFV